MSFDIDDVDRLEAKAEAAKSNLSFRLWMDHKDVAEEVFLLRNLLCTFGHSLREKIEFFGPALDRQDIEIDRLTNELEDAKATLTHELEDAKATIRSLEEGISAQDEILTNRLNEQIRRNTEQDARIRELLAENFRKDQLIRNLGEQIAYLDSWGAGAIAELKRFKEFKANE
jgi:hypothetical protein